MRSALLCVTHHSHTFLDTRSVAQSTMGCTYCERLMHFLSSSWAFSKPWPWSPLKPRMGSILWYLGPSPFMPEHFPSWKSRVNRNVAVRSADHDSSLSCFDFCTPPPAGQMFQAVGALADLCFRSKMKGFHRSNWKRIFQPSLGGWEENSVICSDWNKCVW